MSRLKSFVNHKYFYTTLSIFALLAYSFIVFAAPPGSQYNPAETLDPNCAPGATNCSVDIGTYADQVTIFGSGTSADPFYTQVNTDQITILGDAQNGFYVDPAGLAEQVIVGVDGTYIVGSGVVGDPLTGTGYTNTDGQTVLGDGTVGNPLTSFTYADGDIIQGDGTLASPLQATINVDGGMLTGNGTSATPLTVTVYSDQATLLGSGIPGDPFYVYPIGLAQQVAVAVDNFTITGDGTVASPLTGTGYVYTDGVTITGDGTSGNPLVGASGLPDQTGHAGEYLTTDGSIASWSTIAGGGIVSIGTIDTLAKSADGAVISGNSIVFQTAGETDVGMVSAGIQTFGGAKTFASAPTFSTMTSGSVLFAGTAGILTQDNAGLFWENTNNKLAITSSNSTGVTTSASLVLNANSLTSGTGFYGASSTLSSGSLFDLAVTGTAAASNTQKVLNISTSGANATSTQTTYGGYFSNTHTGTSSTNIGLYSTASGGSNNYAGIFAAGNVGIGDTTPASALTVGSGDLFQVDSSGNIVKINNVTYSWPASQAGGSGYFLVNNGSGTLTWTAVVPGTGLIGSTSTGGTETFLGTTLAGLGTISTAGTVSVGIDSGKNSTTAGNGVFIGYQAGLSALSTAPVLIGYQAGYQAGSGNAITRGVGIGDSALYGATGEYPIAIGSNAGYNAVISQAIAIGTSAGENSTGTGMIAFGNSAGRNPVGNLASSILIGGAAGEGAHSPSHSIFIGTRAGYNDTVDNYIDVSNSDSSILLGAYTSTGGFSDSIAIGTGATNTAENQLVIGGTVASGVVDGDRQISSVFIGNGVTTASPAGFSLNASGGSGTNIAGSSMTLAAGKATGNAAGGSLIFQTSDVGSSGATLQTLTTKAIILNTGAFGIGDTTPDYRLDVADTGIDNNIFALTDSDGECLHNPESGSEVVSCSSDERLKTNIVDTESALDYFDAFVIRDYDVIASGDRMTGVIAQEVLNIYPELVTRGSNGFYSVELPNQWKIVKAIQELDLKITDIENFATTQNQTFLQNLIAWLGDVANGIIEIASDTIRARQQLCVGNTCVTEAQLQELLDQNQISAPVDGEVPDPVTVPENDTEPEGSDSASDTEDTGTGGDDTDPGDSSDTETSEPFDNDDTDDIVGNEYSEPFVVDPSIIE